MVALASAAYSLGLTSLDKAAPTVPPPPSRLTVGAAKCGGSCGVSESTTRALSIGLAAAVSAGRRRFHS
eukprot:SAG11_NODE_2061_length_3871_cov_6.900583_3_plen_69_part_00